LAIFFAFITSHATTIVAVGGYLMSQAGTTMPDLGTANFWKVYLHDFFKAITASRRPSK
jgi:hypothetical protein